MAQSPGSLDVDAASDVCLEVVERVEEAVVVDREVLLETLAAVLARGHVLVEDVPGTGKTVLARVLAESLGLSFTRIQFTPDLLPADVTGSNVYNEHERSFEFAEGPVFSNVVLADEINRAPPKTQAALLEAMEERQVSVDGETHPLPEPFVVVATQNPVEQEGTFQLPEAQRDRFSVKTAMGYPDVDGEMSLLELRANRRTISPSVDPAVTPETVQALQNLTEDVRVDEKVRRYIVDLARATRDDDRTEVGVSPRGVQRVFEAVRASAVMGGRTYATPDDVKRLATATMAHRLVLTTEATVEGVDPVAIVRDAMDAVDVPAVSPDAPDPGASVDEPPSGGERDSSPDRTAGGDRSPVRDPSGQSGGGDRSTAERPRNQSESADRSPEDGSRSQSESTDRPPTDASQSQSESTDRPPTDGSRGQSGSRPPDPTQSGPSDTDRSSPPRSEPSGDRGAGPDSDGRTPGDRSSRTENVDADRSSRRSRTTDGERPAGSDPEQTGEGPERTDSRSTGEDQERTDSRPTGEGSERRDSRSTDEERS